MAMATASGKNVTMTSRQLETLSFKSPAGRNNRSKKRDLLMQLPLEIITNIMKYLEPSKLIRLSRVSSQWRTLLLESPILWSTWNINTKDYWDYSNILRALPDVDHHISDLTLSYSAHLKCLAEDVFNRINNGDINNLETLRLYSKFVELYHIIISLVIYTY